MPIMKKLIKKYGDDFDKMFKDIKMNYMQWTKGQLKKKYGQYKQQENTESTTAWI